MRLAPEDEASKEKMVEQLELSRISYFSLFGLGFAESARKDER